MTHIHTHTHTYHIQTHVHRCTHTHIQVYIHAHVHTCTCNIYMYVHTYTYTLYTHIGIFERKTRGRLLHLAKRFGPKRAFFSCKGGYKTYQYDHHIDMFCTPFATEEGPFGAKTFCLVKQSTTCLALTHIHTPSDTCMYVHILQADGGEGS